MSDIGSRIERFLTSDTKLEPLLPLREVSCSGAGGILPGAFDPLHAGHVGMWRSAERLLGCAVEFELSVHNVDKRSLGAAHILGCAGQFQAGMSLWMTKAATFVDKSALFPGATFVVGADTIVRVADPRYYGGQARLRDAAVASINHAGCRFLVAGRCAGGAFQILEQLKLPDALRDLCDEIPEADFRADISSSELRLQ